MSDISENSNDKGFRINARGLSCIPCRCKRQFFHQETKTTKENNVTTTNTILIREIRNLVVVEMSVLMKQVYFNRTDKWEVLKYVRQDGVKVEHLHPKN